MRLSLLQAVQQIHTFPRTENSPKLIDCQIFNAIKVLVYSDIDVHFFKKEKEVILKKKMHSGGNVAIIILVQRLHSTSTYVGCYS